jgi:peptide/nickel transport system substrate-binding protein
VKPKWLALAGALVFALAFAACGGGDKNETGSNQPAQSGASPAAAQQSGGGAKPVRGGTLTIAMARDSTTFDNLKTSDVYSSMVLNNVVESLFEVDKDGKVVGLLVEKSENPQPNVYVWTLRKGIKFTDGTDFTSEVVKFNIDRFRNDEKSVRYQDVKDITNIETPDPSTVRITLKAPFRPFESKFSGGAGYMYNPKAVQALGENLTRDLKDAGTGPFKFVQWQKDTQVVLERNPNYWGKDKDGTQLPYLDRLVFKPFPDENVRLTNIKTGEVDALVGNPPYKDVKDLKSSNDLTVKEIPGPGFSFISLNTSKAPFDNVNLRRAVSYAIDRDQIRKTVFFENGKVLDTTIPESLGPFYQKDASYHPYLKPDVTKAKQELAAGGKPSGFKFSFQISNASPELQQTAELIKDQLKAVGIDMEIQLIEFAKVVENGQKGEFEALGLGWSGSIDPDGNTYTLFYKGAGFNFSKIDNAAMNKAMDDGRELVDPEKAKGAYDQFVKLFQEQVPMIVYYNPPQISTVRKKVQNYPQTYNGYWGSGDFKTVWKLP